MRPGRKQENNNQQGEYGKYPLLKCLHRRPPSGTRPRSMENHIVQMRYRSQRVEQVRVPLVEVHLNIVKGGSRRVSDGGPDYVKCRPHAQCAAWVTFASSSRTYRERAGRNCNPD